MFSQHKLREQQKKKNSQFEEKQMFKNRRKKEMLKLNSAPCFYNTNQESKQGMVCLSLKTKKK